jgi:hypothetical protein
MHVPINFKSPNNISRWQMGFNSAFKGLKDKIVLRNKKQIDTLFYLSSFLHSTSTCFGNICSPSSVCIPYIYNNLYVLFFSVDCLFARLRWNTTKIQSTENYNTYQLYIYSIPPNDGLQICPNHVEVEWRNKLRMNSSSGWFLLHRCIETRSQQSIKNRWNCYFWTSASYCWQSHGEWHSDTTASETGLLLGHTEFWCL